MLNSLDEGTGHRGLHIYIIHMTMKEMKHLYVEEISDNEYNWIFLVMNADKEKHVLYCVKYTHFTRMFVLPVGLKK